MATDTTERERTGEHSHAHQHYGGLVEHHPDQAGSWPRLSRGSPTSHKHSHLPPPGCARMMEPSRDPGECYNPPQS